MLASWTPSFAELIGVLRQVTGRRLPGVTAPAAAVLGMCAAGDALQRVLPFRLPFNFGAVWVVTRGAPVDASATERDLDLRFRAPEDSITDMLRWMHAAGHLTDRQAGRAASAPPPMVGVG